MALVSRGQRPPVKIFQTQRFRPGGDFYETPSTSIHLIVSYKDHAKVASSGFQNWIWECSSKNTTHGPTKIQSTPTNSIKIYIIATFTRGPANNSREPLYTNFSKDLLKHWWPRGSATPQFSYESSLKVDWVPAHRKRGGSAQQAANPQGRSRTPCV